MVKVNQYPVLLVGSEKKNSIPINVLGQEYANHRHMNTLVHYIVQQGGKIMRQIHYDSG